jgi:acetate kinase
MKILALNCGSSSIKYQLYAWHDKKVLTKGTIERIGEGKIKNHLAGIEAIIKFLLDPKNNIIADQKEISAVTHRVVHGGELFKSSVLIDDQVLRAIKSVAHLAPLHNPPNIVGIEAALNLLPAVKQVAVFDTAFHQTMPPQAYMYATPYAWYEKHQVRRYGFHGSSHLYVSKRIAAFLKKPPQEINAIVMHIGNGVSHTAIKNGCSVDTSMGLTPLEGAVMGTRSGDLDPAIITYIMEKENLSAQEVLNLLNKKSGILGITEKYTDRRDVSAQAAAGNKRCQLAIELEAYRLKKYIGSYLAVLGRVDALAFTAGVGENNYLIRAKACENLENLGIKLDPQLNQKVKKPQKELVISTPDSKIVVLVVPTNEEIVMIEDAVALLEGRYKDHSQMDYSFQKD